MGVWGCPYPPVPHFSPTFSLTIYACYVRRLENSRKVGTFKAMYEAKLKFQRGGGGGNSLPCGYEYFLELHSHILGDENF